MSTELHGDIGPPEVAPAYRGLDLWSKANQKRGDTVGCSRATRLKVNGGTVVPCISLVVLRPTRWLRNAAIRAPMQDPR